MTIWDSPGYNGGTKTRQEDLTMRTIKYFDRDMTVEEYVRMEICKNGGTQSVVFKDQLQKACEAMELEFDKKLGKDGLFDLLVENGCSHEELAERYGVGVSSQIYQQTFGITHTDVKRLEKHGALKKVGEYRFRAFGDYKYAALYDIYQFGRMTDENMKKLLQEYPKGKRVTKK